MRPLILCIVFLSFLTGSCKKDQRPVQEELTDPCMIEFAVYQDLDYTSHIYNGLKAELKLTVSKEILLTGANQVLWDTVFNLKGIREYPVKAAPLIINRKFNGIPEGKEAHRVSQVIKYVNADSQVSQHAKGEILPSQPLVKRFLIGL